MGFVGGLSLIDFDGGDCPRPGSVLPNNQRDAVVVPNRALLGGPETFPIDQLSPSFLPSLSLSGRVSIVVGAATQLSVRPSVRPCDKAALHSTPHRNLGLSVIQSSFSHPSPRLIQQPPAHWEKCEKYGVTPLTNGGTDGRPGDPLAHSVVFCCGALSLHRMDHVFCGSLVRWFVVYHGGLVAWRGLARGSVGIGTNEM